MSQSNEVLYCGLEKQYYFHDGVLYTERFPVEWALSHEPETGPVGCLNCACAGSWNGIFIGYCANCAQYVYEGSRGSGFLYQGVSNYHSQQLGENVFSTYLRGVNLSRQIGIPPYNNIPDEDDDMPELIPVNENEAEDEDYSDMPELIPANDDDNVNNVNYFNYLNNLNNLNIANIVNIPENAENVENAINNNTIQY